MADERMVQVSRTNTVRICTVMELVIVSLTERNAPPHLIDRAVWARETMMASLWPDATEMDEDGAKTFLDQKAREHEAKGNKE
jgi:hypothetical protein